jgi:UDP-glucose 4-epimerase
MYARLNGFEATVLRVGNLYGPGQRGDRGQGAVATFLAKARSGEIIEIFGDGSDVRDYVSTSDFAGVVASLAPVPSLPCVVNVASGVGVSTREVAELAIVTTRSTSQIRHIDARPFDVHSNVLDISLLQSIVHFYPKSLAEGMRELENC